MEYYGLLNGSFDGELDCQQLENNTKIQIPQKYKNCHSLAIADRILAHSRADDYVKCENRSMNSNNGIVGAHFRKTMRRINVNN